MPEDLKDTVAEERSYSSLLQNRTILLADTSRIQIA